LVSKLDTMPQEGVFMGRPFAFRTTPLHPPAAILLTQPEKSQSRLV